MKEPTDRIGFKVPENLKFFSSVQFHRWILVVGGMTTILETPSFSSTSKYAAESFGEE